MRLIHKNIFNFLLKNKIISENQFGFVKKRSTTNQLITVVDWYSAITNGRCVDCIYIDFEKAFDSVPHILLLYKLNKIGIRGKLFNWIKEFLCNRTFRVKIGDCFSAQKRVGSGVPQGSVLGPLLFLLYINDLPDAMPSGVNIKLYVDDVKIYFSYKATSEIEVMHNALHNLSEWANKWQIRISVKKTFVIHLGNKNPREIYKIDGNAIKVVDTIRDLGISIDDKLLFSGHISQITKNAYSRMRFLFRIIKSKSSRIWIVLYKTYIRPLLEYAPEVWNPSLLKNIGKIEKCKKYFTKRVFCKCQLPPIPYQKRLEYLQLPTLENRRKLFDMFIAHKIFYGHTDLDPFAIFNPSKSFNIPFYRLNNKYRLGKKFIPFAGRATKLWNQLDKEIIMISSLKQFKEKTKSLLND